MHGDFTQAIIYDVLHVGKSVGEKLTQRFKTHHVLRDMLIEGKVTYAELDKSE